VVIRAGGVEAAVAVMEVEVEEEEEEAVVILETLGIIEVQKYTNIEAMVQTPTCRPRIYL